MRYCLKSIFYVIVVVLSSCATPRMFTTLDVLQPAEVTFPANVKNLLIVNNSTLQPYNLGHVKYLNDGLKIVSENLKFDSAALFCAASLRENLENKDFFNTVNMSQINQNTSDNFYKVTPLDNKTATGLCKLYQTEAVLSLDHISTEDVTSSFYNDSGDGTSYALDVKVRTIWSLHYPNKLKPKYIQFVDSFSWEAPTIKKLPSQYDALVDACILTGSNITDRLIPQWEKQDRYFYVPKNALMEQAMDSVSHRNWNAAITLWERLFNTTKSYRMKFFATNNIAIAYEVLGDLDKAIAYIDIAISLHQNIIFVSDTGGNLFDLLNYRQYLMNRKENVKILNQQLAE